MRTRFAVASLALLPWLHAACAAPTEPVCRPEPIQGYHVAAPYAAPRPQVMIDAPRNLGPSQVMVASMTEEERTEALRAAVSVATYSPAPFQFYVSAPVETVVVEPQYADPYYGTYRTGSPAPCDYGPGYSLLRTAAYTGMGAIIGHQFHDKGAGAAIGAGVGYSSASRRYGSETREETVERCDVRYEHTTEERIDGYRVTYEYNGREYTTRLPYDPGERIRVRVAVAPAE